MILICQSNDARANVRPHHQEEREHTIEEKALNRVVSPLTRIHWGVEHRETVRITGNLVLFDDSIRGHSHNLQEPS